MHNNEYLWKKTQKEIKDKKIKQLKSNYQKSNKKILEYKKRIKEINKLISNNENKEEILELKREEKVLISKIKKYQNDFLSLRNELFPNIEEYLEHRWDLFNMLNEISAIERFEKYRKDKLKDYKSYNEIILELSDKIDYQQKKINLIARANIFFE